MHRLISTVVLVAVHATGAASQQTAQAKKPPFDPTAPLIALEDSRAKALVKRDRPTFERILAPKFVYTQDDRSVAREDLIRETFAATDTITDAHNDEVAVQIFGTTAIVTGVRIVAGRSKGVPFEHRYRFTDTWVPRSGSWQMVGAHDYLIPKK